MWGFRVPADGPTGEGPARAMGIGCASGLTRRPHRGALTVAADTTVSLSTGVDIITGNAALCFFFSSRMGEDGGINPRV